MKDPKAFGRAVAGCDRCELCGNMTALAVTRASWDEILGDRILELCPEGKPGYHCMECWLKHDWLRLGATC